MAAILDLEVNHRSNHRNNITYEFSDPQNAKKDILDCIVSPTIWGLIFIITDGRHFGFGALVDSTYTFVKGIGANLAILPSWKKIPLSIIQLCLSRAFIRVQYGGTTTILKKLDFRSLKPAAILNLKVKRRSNHQNIIKYEFSDPNNGKNDILYSIVGPTIGKLIFKMADGGHFEFRAPTELAHQISKCMGAIFFH